MNPKEELAALRQKLNVTIAEVKSTGRDLSDTESAELEATTNRVMELKSIIERGERGAELHNQIGGAPADYEDFKSGVVTPASGQKGFLTPASIKSMAKTNSTQGIKALVAGGSSTTPVPLGANPIQIGQTGLGLLSLIPTKVREAPNYSYLRQTVRTSNAAVVAPGGTKPTSVYTVATIPGSLAVVAHLSEPTDKFVLEDNDDLERFLTSELTYGVVRKVTADATAAFLATSGIQTYATAAGRTAAKDLDGLYAGMSLVTDVGFNPNLIIVSRATYDSMRTAKDADGRYHAGNPFEGGTNPGLWGITTLISPDMPNNKALVLDTDAVGLSIDRSGIVTDWDAISGFATNTVRARTEGRFGYDVFVPAALVAVTFTA